MIRARRPIVLCEVALLVAVSVAAAALTGPMPAAATEVKIHRSAGQRAFLAGTADGISIDPQGGLRLTASLERLAVIDQPFLIAAEPHGDGWAVGVGDTGKVLAVDRDGAVRELLDAPEGQIFALLSEPDGGLLAASSPYGKVYRLPPGGGEAEVFFEPGELYIWDLARAADGSLLVATGAEGKLFRVTAPGRGELLYDSTEAHLRALLPLPGGDLLVGTGGEGLVLRVTLAAGGASAVTLYDAPAPEVVAFAAGPDGALYGAAVKADGDPGFRPPGLAGLAAAGMGGAGVGGAGGGERTAGTPASASYGSAPYGSAPGIAAEEPSPASGAPPSTATGLTGRPPGALLNGPRTGAGAAAAGEALTSEIFQLTAADRIDRVWAFERETVYDLRWHAGRLWVATGVDGRIFSLGPRGLVLEEQLEEKQAYALLPLPAGAGETGLAVATTNAPALFVTAAGRSRRGSYTSAPIDAGRRADFGTFHWWGEEPAGTAVELSFRTGVSPKPDDTWSRWSEPRRGREISLDRLSGRYLQWRASLSASADISPQVDGVEVSYREHNSRPRIRSLIVMEPGKILAAVSFNPADQVFEPVHPNRDGIFTTLEARDPGAGGLVKPLWKRGYRSLSWQAEDPNGDALRYALSFRAESNPGGSWLPIAEDLQVDHYSFDVTVLPDGLYRFRLEASDDADNPPPGALADQMVSEPVAVDHSPPRIVAARRRGDEVAVTVEDALNPLSRVEMSVDAGAWQPVTAVDGLVDSRREELRLPLPDDAELVLLRVMDAAFNNATIDLLAEVR